jgi:O-antigen ligase
MVSAGALIFVALLAIATWVSPLLSLYLFVLTSPLVAANDVLGWDPRVRWAFLLCLRGAWETWRTGRNYVPSAAWKIWAGFTVLAAGGLWIGNSGLVPDELEASRSLLLYFVAGSCGVYGIWQLVRSKQQLRTLSAVFAASVLMASAIGVVQAHVSYRLGDPSDRIAGPLGNPNYFATYLALAATTLVLLVRLNLIKRWYGFIACAAAVVACGLTLSRTGIMAILVGVGLASLVRYDRKLLSTRMIAVAGIIALVGSTLLTTYVLGYRRSLTYSDRASQEQVAETLQAAEDLSRLEAFRYSVQLTAEHPLAGVGFGTFQARNYDANGLYVTTHNTVMQVLVGTGLLGGILILSLIFSLVRPLHLHARRHLFPVAVTFGICCLFGDYLQSIDVFVIFAVLYLSVRNLIQGSPATSDQETQPCAV